MHCVSSQPCASFLAFNLRPLEVKQKREGLSIEYKKTDLLSQIYLPLSPPAARDYSGVLPK